MTVKILKVRSGRTEAVRCTVANMIGMLQYCVAGLVPYTLARLHPRTLKSDCLTKQPIALKVVWMLEFRYRANYARF